MNYFEYFSNNTTEKIAQDLLGRTFTYKSDSKILGGIIVETEAYLGKKDRTAHSFGGRRTPANEGLYGKGGTIYIYAQRQYFFFDIATQQQDIPEGILIRAIEPTIGVNTMIKNRHGKNGVLLTNGPAKLMQAFGISSRYWDLHQLAESPFSIDLTQKKSPKKIISAPRIGVNKRDIVWTNKPLRFYVANNPYVSDMKKRNYSLTNGWK